MLLVGRSGMAKQGQEQQEGRTQVRHILKGVCEEGPGEAFEGHKIFADIITSEAH